MATEEEEEGEGEGEKEGERGRRRRRGRGRGRRRGGGGGGGRRESDSLVRLRTESEMSGEVSSTGSKSPNQGVGEEGGGGVCQPDVEEVLGGREGEEDSLKMWSHLLKNWEESVKKNAKQVRQRAREGIPGILRGMAWQLMCGAQDHNLRDRYPVLLTVSIPLIYTESLNLLTTLA